MLLKILLICPSYPPAATGEAEHCLQFAAHLADRGHRVTVLTDAHPAPHADDRFQLLAVRHGWRWRDLPSLLAQLRATRADAVLLIYSGWMYGDHPMITFLAQYLRLCLPAARLAVMVEVPDGSRAGVLPVRLGRLLLAVMAGRRGMDYNFGTLLRDSHAVFVLGPTIEANLLPRCAGLTQRLHVLPPPPLLVMPRGHSEDSRQATRVRLGVLPDEQLLAFFGFVIADKGVDTLLRAVRLMRNAGQPVRLIMAGGGRTVDADGRVCPANAYEASQMALAATLGLERVVIWPAGYDSGSDAPARDLLAADLAVLPFDDGAQLRRSSIAAVAMLGLPIVTTAPLAGETAFVADVNVACAAPRDAADLARVVGRVVGEAELRQQLQLGARQLARDWFSWERNIDGLLRAFGGVTPERPAGSG